MSVDPGGLRGGVVAAEMVKLVVAVVEPGVLPCLLAVWERLLVPVVIRGSEVIMKVLVTVAPGAKLSLNDCGV